VCTYQKTELDDVDQRYRGMIGRFIALIRQPSVIHGARSHML